MRREEGRKKERKKKDAVGMTSCKMNRRTNPHELKDDAIIMKSIISFVLAQKSNAFVCNLSSKSNFPSVTDEN